MFSGKVTGVTSFGLFVTLDTLFVEGLIHISELGSDYFNFSEVSNELIGERTGKRYRLGDSVQIQVARVDLEARRIEFVPVKGLSYAAVQKELSGEVSGERHFKRPAKPKPSALKGQTAQQRRASLKREQKKANNSVAKKTVSSSTKKRTGAKKSSRKQRR